MRGTATDHEASNQSFLARFVAGCSALPPFSVSSWLATASATCTGCAHQSVPPAADPSRSVVPTGSMGQQMACTVQVNVHLSHGCQQMHSGTQLHIMRVCAEQQARTLAVPLTPRSCTCAGAGAAAVAVDVPAPGAAPERPPIMALSWSLTALPCSSTGMCISVHMPVATDFATGSVQHLGLWRAYRLLAQTCQ